MPHASQVDAIIVGAGPAGSTTALLLAGAGHHVVLLDRRRFPRAKPCGDCLSAQATLVLDRLGVLPTVEAERPARLVGWRIISPAGHACSSTFAACSGDARTGSALSLRRDRLDFAILEGARRAGAEVRTGVHVTDLLRNGDGRVTGVRGRDAHGAPLELRARFVVGADGLRSIVARRLGLLGRPSRLRKVSLTAHLKRVRDVDAFGEMHLAPRACAGLAPVSAPDDPDERICNLTLVVRAEDHARAIARDPEAFYWTMLGRFPRLAGRLDDATFAEPTENGEPRFLASGSFDQPTRDVVAHGAALVGDAAGYFDPLTGQGIHHALTGAEFLAEEADALLRAGDAAANRLRRYGRCLRWRMREAHALQRAIEFVTARPALADLAIRRLGKAPATTAALIAATADITPARSIVAPGVLFGLFFPLLPQEPTP